LCLRIFLRRFLMTLPTDPSSSALRTACRASDRLRRESLEPRRRVAHSLPRPVVS
jgi:hypothetical protein